MAFSHPFFLIVHFSCVHGSSLPSDGQAADRSTNFFSCVHGSCLPRPCLLCFFSLLSIPSHCNLPTLCCSIRFPHFLFSLILVGEEGRKLAEDQANGWRLGLPWRRKTIALVRLRTNFGGRKVGVVVMRWCWNEGMRTCRMGWKMRWKTMKNINKCGEKWSKKRSEINKS